MGCIEWRVLFLGMCCLIPWNVYMLITDHFKTILAILRLQAKTADTFPYENLLFIMQLFGMLIAYITGSVLCLFIKKISKHYIPFVFGIIIACMSATNLLFMECVYQNVPIYVLFSTMMLMAMISCLCGGLLENMLWGYLNNQHEFRFIRSFGIGLNLCGALVNILIISMNGLPVTTTVHIILPCSCILLMIAAFTMYLLVKNYTSVSTEPVANDVPTFISKIRTTFCEKVRETFHDEWQLMLCMVMTYWAVSKVLNAAAIVNEKYFEDANIFSRFSIVFILLFYNVSAAISAMIPVHGPFSPICQNIFCMLVATRTVICMYLTHKIKLDLSMCIVATIVGLTNGCMTNYIWGVLKHNNSSRPYKDIFLAARLLAICLLLGLLLGVIL